MNIHMHMSYRNADHCVRVSLVVNKGCSVKWRYGGMGVCGNARGILLEFVLACHIHCALLHNITTGIQMEGSF